MAFGLHSRLTDIEKSDRRVARRLRKLSRRQMLLDAFYADKERRVREKELVSAREGSVSVKKDSAASGASPDKERAPGLLFRLRIFFEMLFSRLSSFLTKHSSAVLFALGCAAVLVLVSSVAGYLICYDVEFDGNSLGVVSSLSAVDRALDRYQEDLVEQYQLPSIYFERTVTSRRVLRLDHREVLGADEVYEELGRMDFPLFCRGAVITIDGVEAIKLSSVDAAREAIDRFKGLFVTSSADWFTLLKITDLTTQEELGVKEKIIAIGSDYSVDEAVRYLSILAVNGMNAYDAPEDAKKVISYDIDTTSPSSSSDGREYANYDAENFFTTSGIPSTSLIFSADLTPKTAADETLLLNMVVTEEVRYTAVVPYKTEEYESDYYYAGELFTTTAGVNGKSTFHSYITSINGIMVSENVLEEEVLSAPVTERKAKGTKPPPAAYDEGRFVVPTSGLITDTSRDWGSHAGFHAVDIANKLGTGVYASDSGTVTETVWDHYSYGNYIVISHGNGYSTMYAHLDYIGVSTGQEVKQLQFIGRMGSTGESTGPHLHFEIRLNGKTEYLGAYFDCFVYGSYVHVGQSSNASYDDKPVVEPGGTDEPGGDEPGGDTPGTGGSGGTGEGGSGTGEGTGEGEGGGNTGEGTGSGEGGGGSGDGGDGTEQNGS